MAQISRKKLQVLTLPGYVLYFHFSIRIFCNLFICLVFDGLSMVKHSITFDTYLLSCRFHCVDIFNINFRSCETFTLTNSGAILLLIETLSNFRTMKCWFILYLQMQIQMFSLSCVVFLRLKFHWYVYGSNLKHQKYARSFNQSNCRYFAF